MTELEMVEALLGAYAAPSVLVGFLIIKGVAASVNNNLSTKRWPKWIRGGLDWLASSDKKAKETSDIYVDSVVEVAQQMKSKEAGGLVKLIKLFS